ncbi:MAG: LPS export ABC transporter periplasmic protein LptC [Cytophagaceae bacterium]
MNLIQNLLKLIVISLVLLGCRQPNSYEEMKPYDGPLIEVDDIVTIYSDSSIMRLKLKAKKQLEMQNGDREFPKGVYVEFYDEKGIMSSTLTGNKGKFNKEKNLYTVTGNVVVKNVGENKKLNTEELFWEPDKQKVYTDKFVRIETPDEILTGNGLTAKQDFSSYKIKDPIGEFRVKQ